MSNARNISEYRPGSVSSFRTLAFNQGGPRAIAVAADGTLAVAEQPGLGQNGHLVIFDKGSVTPTRTISIPLKGQLVVRVAGVAIDAAGDVFVSVTRYPRRLPEHLVVAPGSTRASMTAFLAGEAEGFDAEGNFYIDFGTQINVYAPGHTQPFREITNGLINAVIFAVSPAGELFVPNTAYANARGNLVVYAPDGQTPIAKLSSNADFDPRGAALRP